MTTGTARVGRPPFGFRIQGPDDWMLLETAPSTWRRSLERLLREHPGAYRQRASLRREATTLLEEVVAVAQQTGVLLCLAKLARDPQGGRFCGSLTLSWYDSTPVAADLAFARLVAGPADRLEELDTPAGGGLLRCETGEGPPAWRELAGDGRVASAQALVPVPGTCWTALISGTVGGAEYAELLERLVRRMAGSLRVDLPAAGFPTPTGNGGAPWGRSSPSPAMR